MGVTRNQSWITNNSEKTSKLYRYYQCQTATNRGNCSYHTWTAVYLEEQVLNKVIELLNSDRDHDLSNTKDGVVSQEELTTHKRQIEKIKKRFEKQIQRSATGLVTIFLLRQLYEQHKLELQKAEAVLQNRENSFNKTTSFDRANTLNLMEKASPEEKQVLLGNLVLSLAVYDKDFEVLLRNS